MSDPRTILVQRLSSIGDIVQATSPLKSIRERFPNARLDFMTLSHFAPLLEGHPFIDRIIKIHKDEPILTLLYLGKEIDDEYDMIIDLHNSLRTKIMRRSIQKGKTIIYRKPRWDRFKLFQFHQNDFEDGFDQRALYHKSLTSILGNDHSIPETRLNVSEPEKAQARSLLKKKGIEGNYIAVVPGAEWETKIWLRSRYKEVLANIIYDQKLSVVILGSEKDDVCDEINIEHTNSLNLKGQTDLRTSLSIISNAQIVLGSDTGLVHAAEASNVPAVMIMGPTSVETGGGTFLEESNTLENTDLWCRPCSQNGKHPCYRKEQYCMTSISTDALLSSVKKALAI